MKWLLFGLPVFSLVTLGGWRFLAVEDFGGQQRIEFAPGLASDVWLQPTESYVGIPLLLHFSSLKPPYGIRVQIWDDDGEFEAIDVTEVSVKYSDGTSSSLKNGWFRKLRERPSLPGHRMLSDVIEGVVSKHVGAAVTLRGRMIRASGSDVPFSVANSYEPKSHSTNMPNFMWYNE